MAITDEMEMKTMIDLKRMLQGKRDETLIGEETSYAPGGGGMDSSLFLTRLHPFSFYPLRDM